ncbi:hypothetical protein BH11PSE12_BH11PSE12_23650 [soil metagenome]
MANVATSPKRNNDNDQQKPGGLAQAAQTAPLTNRSVQSQQLKKP